MMKTRLSLPFAVLLSIMMLTSITCGVVVSAPTAAPAPVQYATVVFTATPQPGLPSPTFTPQPPQVVTQIVTVLPPTSSGPSCTVLQDLNFRFGPGTAYDPPLYQIFKNDVVIPVGYKAQGIPGGSWVMVRDPDTNQQGWVSAGPQYVSCNVDVTTLPSVAVAPPPVAALPDSALSSDPDGNGFCLDVSSIECIVIFSDASLMQFRLLQNNREVTENNGLDQVTFRVETTGGDFVYLQDEFSAPYCIFGGSGSCNEWFVEDGVYRWPSGERVREGEYQIEIEIYYDGEFSLWFADFYIDLP